MKRKLPYLSFCLVFALAACSSATDQNASNQSAGALLSSSQTQSTDSSKGSQTAVESDSAHHFHDGKKVGERIRLSLDQACLKKNQDEQFILLYVKDDCEYCAQFDEVLNPYLQEHPLTIYEVDLTQAEEMYLDEDREAMLDILSAGVDRTPALYYIESQEKVNLLDHTSDNYSTDGLNQWVEKYDLEKLN